MKRLLTSRGGAPEDGKELGTHSLRHTWLAWAARAGWSSGTRRSLGYRTTPKDRGRLEYTMDELAAGDRVLYQKYTGQEVTWDSQEYIVIRFQDVLAKLVD